jgi:EAL domain-containing protein (putative c-di-GMP-specific phosphodiesterase class I)
MTSFRRQFIFSASSMEVTGVEILAGNPSRLRLDDPIAMLEHDLSALHHGCELACQSGLRVQCNVEPSSVVIGLSRMLKAISAGIVVELVERHVCNDDRAFDLLVDGALRLRKAGALIALDDVTPNAMEIELIRALRPDIIKVENRAALSGVLKVAATRHLIAERVETKGHADLACAMGVRELQGFWCDRQHQIPEVVPATIAVAVAPC